MSKIIVLGAGMVGSAMAIDLVKNHQVALAKEMGVTAFVDCGVAPRYGQPPARLLQRKAEADTF